MPTKIMHILQGRSCGGSPWLPRETQSQFSPVYRSHSNGPSPHHKQQASPMKGHHGSYVNGNTLDGAPGSSDMMMWRRDPGHSSSGQATEDDDAAYGNPSTGTTVRKRRRHKNLARPWYCPAPECDRRYEEWRRYVLKVRLFLPVCEWRPRMT